MGGGEPLRVKIWSLLRERPTVLNATLFDDTHMLQRNDRSPEIRIEPPSVSPNGTRSSTGFTWTAKPLAKSIGKLELAAGKLRCL